MAEAGCTDCLTIYEVDWRVADDTVVRPDVAILSGPRTEGDYIETPPRLIVEVASPSTAEKDRTAKFQLYEGQAVGYYFLVDADRQTISTWQLTGRQYEPLAAGTQWQLILAESCQFELSLANVFDEQHPV